MTESRLENMIEFKGIEINSDSASHRSEPLSRVNYKTLRIERYLKSIAKSVGFVAMPASQLCLPFTMFVYLNHEKRRPNVWSGYQGLDVKDFNTVINPVILETDQMQAAEFEEFSDIDDVQFGFKRPVGIKVQYLDSSLELREEEIRGFKSRVFQNMIDILDGIDPKTTFNQENWGLNQIPHRYYQFYLDRHFDFETCTTDKDYNDFMLNREELELEYEEYKRELKGDLEGLLGDMKQDI